jgi:hypothetical protein
MFSPDPVRPFQADILCKVWEALSTTYRSRHVSFDGRSVTRSAI